jgi:predicted nuclease of predicted toxin-antitoxin system
VVEQRFLLDEDVSPKHVLCFAERGFYAEHVVHIGLSGAKDWQLFRYAQEKSLIVVTKNAVDYLELASDSDLHAGMILLRDGHLLVEEEWQWIEPVLDHIASTQLDPLNKVIDVTARGRFQILDVPP